MTQGIVFLERDAPFPTWIDDDLGPVSDVTVIAQQPLETCREFEGRAAAVLAAVPEGQEPLVGVVAVGPDAGPEHEALARTVTAGLRALAVRAGTGRILLSGPPGSPAVEAVARTARCGAAPWPAVRVVDDPAGAASADVRRVA